MKVGNQAAGLVAHARGCLVDAIDCAWRPTPDIGVVAIRSVNDVLHPALIDPAALLVLIRLAFARVAPRTVKFCLHARVLQDVVDVR